MGGNCRDKLGENLHINKVTQPHCDLMEEVKRNEMERRAKGGQDCRVGHVCDVSALTSWLYQQVVHVGSSGRVELQNIPVTSACVPIGNRQRASIKIPSCRILPDPFYWMSDALNLLHICVSKSNILPVLLLRCHLTLNLSQLFYQPGHSYACVF